MHAVSLQCKKLALLVTLLCVGLDIWERGAHLGVLSASADSPQYEVDPESITSAPLMAPTLIPTPLVVLLHDEDLDGVPDEVAGGEEYLLGSYQCASNDTSCGLALAMKHLPENAKVLLRAKKKCPTRKVKRVISSSRVLLRQNISSLAKKRCRKPTRKPTIKPTGTPNPKVTATPKGGEPLPAPSPEPTKVPTPSATATPSGGSGGNAAVGKSFYSQVCTSCHGVKGGKSAQQVLAAMSSIAEHSSVKSLVSTQTANDIAAYLTTVR